MGTGFTWPEANQEGARAFSPLGALRWGASRKVMGSVVPGRVREEAQEREQEVQILEWVRASLSNGSSLTQKAGANSSHSMMGIGTRLLA